MIVSALLIAIVAVFWLGFIALGLSLVGLSLSELGQVTSTWLRALASRKWPSTTGELERSVITRRRHRRTVSYGLEARFRYAVAGEQHSSTNLSFSQSESGLVGSLDSVREVAKRYPAHGSVTVYYDPKRPALATLDRTLPALFVPLVFWLVLLPFGGALAFLGVDAFISVIDEPPPFEAGELPSEATQLGGVLVGVGVLSLLVAGIRALGQRDARRLLQLVSSAKPCLAREAAVGEYVAIQGRAGEGPSGIIAAPFDAEGALAYDVGILDGYDTWRRSEAVSTLVVKDRSGSARLTTLDAKRLFEARDVTITPLVERWVDEYYRGQDQVPPASPKLTLEQLRVGDPLLLVGEVESTDEFGAMLVARPGEPDTLLYADAPLEELLARLGRGPRRTRLSAIVGTALIVVGAVLGIVG